MRNVEIDGDDLARTYTVQYHLRKPGANSDIVRKEMPLPSQRLVLIPPTEEEDS